MRKIVGVALMAVMAGVVTLGMAMHYSKVARLKKELSDGKAALIEAKTEAVSKPTRQTEVVYVHVEPTWREDGRPAILVDGEPVEAEITVQAVTMPEARQRREMPQFDEARRQEFADRMRQRNAEAREAMIENLGLTDAHVGRMDAIVGDLNQHVANICDVWAAHIRETGRFENDYPLRLMHEISGAMVAACDAMDAQIPGNWREASGRMGVMSWLDTDAFAPVIEAAQSVGGGNFMMGMPPMGGGGAIMRGGGGRQRPQQ